MKIKYITEGVFKTPAQMKAEKERRSSKEDSEIVTKIARSYFNDKINAAIQDIMTRHKRLTLIGTDVFYGRFQNTKKPEESVECQLTFEKKEVDCKIDNSGETPIIYLDFHLGKFISSGRYKVPCKNNEIYVEDLRWNSVRLNKKSNSEQFSRDLKKCIQKDINNGINNSIYEFILNSNIVVNKIYMYENSGIDELIIKSYPLERSFTKMEIQMEPRQQEKILNGLMIKPNFDELLNLITFAVPVKVEINIKMSGFSSRGSMLPFANISTLFSGYNNLAELENAAGLNGFIENLSINNNQNFDDDTKDLYNKDQIVEFTGECTKIYIRFDWNVIGSYHENTGLAFDSINGPYINMCRFWNPSRFKMSFTILYYDDKINYLHSLSEYITAKKGDKIYTDLLKFKYFIENTLRPNQ